MKNTLISVVMAAYNEELAQLQGAVESILTQTYPHFEFLIVLDNPDNEVIRAYLQEIEKKDERVRLLINEKNIGLANSLNRGLSHAHGEYVARMDADDISMPTRFEEQIAYLEENPSCDVLFTDRRDIDEEGNSLPTSHAVISEKGIICRALEYGNFLTHPSVMMRKQAIDKVGGYRAFNVTEDYDLWLRMRKAGLSFGILPHCLLKYRIRSTGISKSNVAKLHAFALYAQYLDKIEKAGEDLMSEEGLTVFLKKKKLFTEEDKKKYNRAYALMSESGVGVLGKLWRRLKGAFLHREAFLYMLNSRKKDKLLKSYVTEE